MVFTILNPEKAVSQEDVAYKEAIIYGTFYKLKNACILSNQGLGLFDLIRTFLV